MAYRYLVECREKPCCDYGTNDYHFKNAEVVKLWPYQKVVGPNELAARDYNAQVKGREEGRTEGQNEAWELAQKIMCRSECGGYTIADLRQAFHVTDAVPDRDVPGVCILMELFAVASSSLKEVELQKDKQIAVGDVLITPANTKALVTCIIPGYIYLVFSDGSCNRVPLENIKELYKKTGQSFDPSTLLDKLKEEE